MKRTQTCWALLSQDRHPKMSSIEVAATTWSTLLLWQHGSQKSWLRPSEESKVEERRSPSEREVSFVGNCEIPPRYQITKICWTQKWLDKGLTERIRNFTFAPLRHHSLGHFLDIYIFLYLIVLRWDQQSYTRLHIAWRQKKRPAITIINLF